MGDETPLKLSPHFADFIKSQVADGRYDTESDVVAAALSLLEAEELQRKAVIAALIEGENSGPAEPFDFDLFLAARRAEKD